MKKSFKKFGRRVCSVVCAGTLAFSLSAASVVSAFAAAPEGYKAMDAGNYVSASPTPFSAALPCLLGLNLTDERWGIDKTADGEPGYWLDNVVNTSGALKYLLMGSPDYNTNPDAYLYNMVYNTDGVKTIEKGSRTVYSSSNAGRALGEYGKAPTADDVIWDMKPDVIFGTYTTDADHQTDYKSEVAAMKESNPEKFTEDYNPIGVDVLAYFNDDQCGLMYAVAEAADQVVANSNGTKQLRYGNATELAKNYESIVRGSQGYILAQLDADKAQKKTIAYVTVNDGTNVTLSGTLSGAASKLSNVSKNYVTDKLEGDATTLTMSCADLIAASKDIDLIVLMTNDVDRNPVTPVGLESIYNKLYWATDSDCGTIGSDKNGPDMAINYCRLMSCLYPEYMDQSDWVAYYYDTVYHIKADALNKAIDKAMDGVRNWDVQSGSNGDAYLQWTATTAADYNKAEVKEKLDYGLAWLKANQEDVPEDLQLSDKINGSVANVSELRNPVEAAPTVSKEGTTTSWQKGSNTKPTFRSTASLKYFVRVLVNNQVLDPQHYTVKEGSTIVEIEPAYMETLPAGNHTIAIESTTGTATATLSVNEAAPAGTVLMYRLYNPNSGEHLYTKDANEYSVLGSIGWNQEGTAWIAPESGEKVYRLYNPNSGDHHYTKDANEYDVLGSLGWNQEGEAWYSGGDIPVYRLFNPNVTIGTHHYTTDENEYTTLQGLGWKPENVGWNAVAAK